jgi:hypothetical protein
VESGLLESILLHSKVWELSRARTGVANVSWIELCRFMVADQTLRVMRMTKDISMPTGTMYLF